jgi:tRNA pseudouridine38-40 synthase
MRRLRFHVSYDGTGFYGWQVQPERSTIQGALESVISRIEGSPVHVAGSGRTDAGVHALAQVAAVTITNPIPVDNFRRAVNRLLPTAIRVANVEEVDMNFHPRFQAKRKTYEYRIFRQEICPPFERNFVHHYPYPLAEDIMIRAALVFEGEHDFGAFAAADDKRDALGYSKVRRIFTSKLEARGQTMIYRVTGSGFLKHMVRNMVGVLIETGRGNISIEGLGQRLQTGNTFRAGPTAPASGLFLVSVDYSDYPPTPIASFLSAE